jgi:hypothetical protein
MKNYIESRHHFVGANGIYDFGLGDQHGLTNATFIGHSLECQDGSIRCGERTRRLAAEATIVIEKLLPREQLPTMVAIYRYATLNERAKQLL